MKEVKALKKNKLPILLAAVLEDTAEIGLEKCAYYLVSIDD